MEYIKGQVKLQGIPRESPGIPKESLKYRINIHEAGKGLRLPWGKLHTLFVHDYKNYKNYNFFEKSNRFLEITNQQPCGWERANVTLRGTS